MTTVKSKGLYGRKFLDIQERVAEIAEPDDQHVLVKVKACGVCGTDANFVRDWEGEYKALGHEIAAEVIQVGREVPNLKPGDRVIVEDVSLCGICEACKRGQPQFCRNMYSIEGQPGMGQYMSVRYNSLDKFEGLDDVAACLTEPLTVSLTAVQEADIPLGGSVLVLGAGPLGLMAAQVAKLRGASFVAVAGSHTDNVRNRARLKAAEHFGCDMIIDSSKQTAQDALKPRFPDGVDRIIVSSPPQSLYEALALIRYGGIITYFGLHLGNQSVVELDINELIFRKITLKPVFTEPALNFSISNQLLREGRVNAHALISHTFGFENAGAAFADLISGDQPIIKAVMLPNA